VSDLVDKKIVLDAKQPRIGVVIPCYQVKSQIMSVLESIGPECSAIYVIDDKCPEGTGEFVAGSSSDERVQVLYHAKNQGVGGATLTGYRHALADGVSIVVKIDGDGQMDPRHLTRIVTPIILDKADYTKGNRFYSIEQVMGMPVIRIIGNLALSFMSKLSTGYWNLFDPTNGFTAIHAGVINHLPLDKINRRFFFETDMLFRLNLVKARVIDIPLDARYGDELSNLSLVRSIFEFPIRHTVNFCKRILYGYFLRDFSLASVQLVAGMLLLLFGIGFGVFNWISLASIGVAATAGTVMLAGLPVIVGTELILAFLAYDISSVPDITIHTILDMETLPPDLHQESL
jgi:glycosyltransferase involved in cell wall biosynthesis